jgi:hypothetical protein
VKKLWPAFASVLAAAFGLAEQLDALSLPPGFHAGIVTECLGPVRQLALRASPSLGQKVF